MGGNAILTLVIYSILTVMLAWFVYSFNKELIDSSGEYKKPRFLFYSLASVIALALAWVFVIVMLFMPSVPVIITHHYTDSAGHTVVFNTPVSTLLKSK